MKKARNAKVSRLYVCGINVAQEVLQHQADQILEVYIAMGKTAQNESIAQITQVARQAGFPVRQVPEKKLREYVGSAKHQGVALKLKAFPYQTLEDLVASISRPNPGLLILEQIEDPHNVGAIIRSATAMGIDGIVMLNHNQAPINATSYRTSAGTAGRVPIARTSNLRQAVSTLKEKGYWIAGLAMDGEPITDNTQIANSPIALVIGNEGTGLRQSTREACDFLVSIPMDNGVESLNASVSAAVAMYEWRRIRE